MGSYYKVVPSLKHHGIQGMHWGERNGPPYPLDQQTHNEVISDSGSKSKRSMKLTDTQKKWIKRGAIAVAAVGLTAGGIYLAKSGHLQNIGKIALQKGYGAIDDLSSFPDMPTSHNIRTDYKGINPNRNAKNLSNINFELLTEDKKPLYNVNCQACALAYELKCRGKNVISKLIDTRTMSPESFYSKVYKNARIENVGKINTWSELDKKLIKLGNGARGTLLMELAESKHSISFEVTNGKLYLIDGQIEQIFNTNPRIMDSIYKANKNTLKFVRTDNLELNDMNFIYDLISPNFIK